VTVRYSKNCRRKNVLKKPYPSLSEAARKYKKSDENLG
jgi:hypothetical protein